MAKKIKFKLPSGEVLTLNYPEGKKNFLATAPWPNFWGLRRIKVSKYFFSKFTPSDRVAIIYHEFGHYNFQGKWTWEIVRKRPWLIFNIIKVIKELEYKADLHALENTSKKRVLSVLRKLKKLIDKGLLKNHERTHPPIDERIKRIAVK